MRNNKKPIYLDCNATTPIEPAVAAAVIQFMTEEFGNSGSRTHEYGLRAKQAINLAREQVAQVIKAKADEIIFTSGATESNNLAILGLAKWGEKNNRRHIISTAIEHKAVLEPLEFLAKNGFEIDFVAPTPGGWVDPATLQKVLRRDTLLVSVMHVNNETGVIQPIQEIAEVLLDYAAYFHVDAAQSFAKEIAALQHERIDFISISGHKIYAPKGVGALVARKRGFNRPPLQPLMFGGGQERSLRPGTLPVPQIVGLGAAAELGERNHAERAAVCRAFQRRALDTFEPLAPIFNGDLERMLPHTLNISFAGIDSEALIVALKSEIAISNGSACTSQSYELSHVLQAMNLSPDVIRGAIRLSWCHLTAEPNWQEIVASIANLS